MKTKLHNYFYKLALSQKKKALGKLSGLNTLESYSVKTDREIFPDREPSDSALMKGLALLNDYIDDLSNNDQELTSNDLYLKNRVEIEKIGMSPILPSLFKCDINSTRIRLNTIYKMIVNIHREFMALHNIFHSNSDFLPYLRLFDMEKKIIETLYISMKKLVFFNNQDKALYDKYFRFCCEFNELLLNSNDLKDVFSWDGKADKIFSSLNTINESNEIIYRHLAALNDTWIQIEQDQSFDHYRKTGVST